MSMSLVEVSIKSAGYKKDQSIIENIQFLTSINKHNHSLLVLKKE